MFINAFFCCNFGLMNNILYASIICRYALMVWGPGSSFSIVTRLQAGRPDLDSYQGREFVLIATASRPALRLSQPPIQWGTLVPSSEVKRAEREADYTPSSSAEVEKQWSCTSTSHTYLWLLLDKYRVQEGNEAVLQCRTDLQTAWTGNTALFLLVVIKG